MAHDWKRPNVRYWTDITFLPSPAYQLPIGLFRCAKLNKLFKCQKTDSKWSDKPLVVKENEKKGNLAKFTFSRFYYIMILEVLWHSIDTFPKENIMHSLKQMTLNLPKWPWVKMMTHIQIFCNLWQIVWSENSPSFYSLDTNNALFLQVTLNLSKWPWVKVLSHLGPSTVFVWYRNS